jgi:hypothetical protein
VETNFKNRDVKDRANNNLEDYEKMKILENSKGNLKLLLIPKLKKNWNLLIKNKLIKLKIIFLDFLIKIRKSKRT